MIGKEKEHWRQLCERAAVEQDPKKLVELAKEIIRILDEKEARLKRGNNPSDNRGNNPSDPGPH